MKYYQLVSACRNTQNRPAGSPTGAAGTLVVGVPCSEGLLVVADRRTTLKGEHVDGATKLEVLAGPPPTVITVTGTGEFIDEAPMGESAASWLAKAPRRLDATQIVRSAVSKRGHVLDPSTLPQIAGELVAELKSFFAQHPRGLLARYRDSELCRAVLFQCDIDSDLPRRVIATFVVTISSTDEIEAADYIVRLFDAYERFEVCRFGETEYVNQHVLSGSGRAHLPRRFFELFDSSFRIGELTPADAEYIAHTLIVAAESTSAVIPIPSGNGIGGGTTIHLLRCDRVDARSSPPV